MRIDDNLVVADTSGIIDARQMVRSFAAATLPSERVDDLALVTSELVTNALEHGTGEPVDVRIHSEPTRIELTVSSPSFGQLDATPHMPPADQVRGRGLFLVAALSDEVVIDQSSGAVSITSHFASG